MEKWGTSYVGSHWLHGIISAKKIRCVHFHLPKAMPSQYRFLSGVDVYVKYISSLKIHFETTNSIRIDCDDEALLDVHKLIAV